MLPVEVTIREVGPRDGLQVEAPQPVDARVAMIEGLVACGLCAIEAAAFVSPARVPAMADPAAVFQHLSRRPGVTYFALVPNLRGAQMALEAGADALTVTASASQAYSRRNVGRGRDEAAREVAAILDFVGGALLVDVVVSCAFGYTNHEAPDLEWVADQAGRWADHGPCSLTLADTTGEASPPLIGRAVDVLGADVGLHLHDSRGTALTNAYAALLAGVGRFDTSVAGLGGSPFAEGAAGNLATEDLVHLLGLLGVDSGVDLQALLAQVEQVSDLLGRPLERALVSAGPAAGFRPPPPGRTVP